MDHTKKKLFFKNLHLTVSAIFIIPIALVYGLYPQLTLQKLLDITTGNITLSNIFRAIMGIYLSMAALWITGIFKPKFWLTATISNIVFMGGLALGRIISMALDGLPTTYFSMGMIAELAFVFWGVKNLTKYGSGYTIN